MRFSQNGGAKNASDAWIKQPIKTAVSIFIFEALKESQQ